MVITPPRLLTTEKVSGIVVGNPYRCPAKEKIYRDNDSPPRQWTRPGPPYQPVSIESIENRGQLC
jgi:hypothetical protein